MSKITASQLRRIKACPGSQHLPHYDESSAAAERGSAIHKYLENLSSMERAEALALVPEGYREDCAIIDTSDLPIGEGYVPERAFLFDSETGEARLIKGETREERYADVRPGRDVGCTMDVLSWGDTAAYVGDYKTGWDAGDPKTSPQLLTGAVCLDAMHGPFETVVLEYIYIHRDGGVRKNRATVGQPELAAHRDYLRAVVAAVADKNAPRAMGEHCRFCPAKRACPEYNANIVSLGMGSQMVERQLWEGGANLTPARVGELWVQYLSFEEGMKELRNQFERYAQEHGGIPLPNGRTLKMAETSAREYMDGEKTWLALKKIHGASLAQAAVKPTATKTSVTAALKEAGVDKEGIGETMEKLRKAGAIRKCKTSLALKEVAE